MGIDIYAKWKGQTKAQKDKQYTGFSLVSGHVGYLREAYHGEPYATHVMFPECFKSDDGEARISYSILRSRLPKTLQAVEERCKSIYKTNDQDITRFKQSYIDFVNLCETMEIKKKEPCTIYASY